jgi:hypothetical protein
LVENGEAQLSRLDEALVKVPSGGIAYLPTCSYREMEGWSLPPDAAIRLSRLERDLGEARAAGPDGALIRGAHWRNFFVKYSESNRMHKKMQALSSLARERGDDGEIRRAIGRAQCNDAYWHGVFGGLYLPHLRDAIWRNLADAEAALRKGEALAWDRLDIDGDGHEEIWVHSAEFSAIVSPYRGGAIEEYTVFNRGINFANVLTRRREAYHDLALERQAAHGGHSGDGTASIHDIETNIRLEERPPLDSEDRALMNERVLPRGVGFDDYARGSYWPVLSWTRRPAGEVAVARKKHGLELTCTVGDGREGLSKRIRFEPDGRISLTYGWDAGIADPDDSFAPEFSFAGELELRCATPADEWRFSIETVAKSERGLDRTRQGESVTLRWPVRLGKAAIEILPTR